MHRTGGFFKGKQDGNRIRSSGRFELGAPCFALAAFGLLFAATVFLLTNTARAQLSEVVGRPVLARQIQRAASLYRLDSPVQLEEHVVKIELRSVEKVGWQVKLPAEILVPQAPPASAGGSGATKPEGFTAVLQYLKAFGEPTVMYSGAWVITGNEPTSVYSGKRIPVGQAPGVGDEKTPLPGEYRELGRRLTVNLEGIDAEKRICFTYSIELNYVESKPAEGGNPTFSNFNAEGRVRAKDGETAVVQNLDGSTALLVFFIPHVIK